MTIGHVVCSHYECFNRADWGTWSKLLDPDLTVHHASAGTIVGRATYFESIRAYRVSFPDVTVEIHRLVEQDDLVAAEFTSTATFRAEFAGIAPTGKTWTLPGMGFYRVARDSLAEAWFVEDFTGWLHRLAA